MAVKDGYTKARAVKKSTSQTRNININNKEKNQFKKQVKRQPIIVVILIALIVGALGGYFAYAILSPFELSAYTVNGVASDENDYIIIDMSQIKENILNKNPDTTDDEIFVSVVLNDEGVVCKFFGKDVSDTVKVEYFYREDISHDVATTDKIDVSVAGVYYIKYTSSHFAFKNTTLIRTIIVTGVENDG